MAHKCREGYPLPGYGGETADEKHCPRCGCDSVAVLSSHIMSGKRIGICQECGENYIITPLTPQTEGQCRWSTQRENV